MFSLINTKPSDLATADGQKKLQGRQESVRAKKSGEQKKTGVYESSIGGGKLTPGAALCLVSPLGPSRGGLLGPQTSPSQRVSFSLPVLDSLNCGTFHDKLNKHTLILLIMKIEKQKQCSTSHQAMNITLSQEKQEIKNVTEFKASSLCTSTVKPNLQG